MTLKDSLKKPFTRLRDSLPIYSYNRLAKTLTRIKENEQEDDRRSIVEQNTIQQVDGIIDQPQPYWLLKRYSNGHPYLRIVHGAVVAEVLRPRWDAQERFAKKCLRCGREYPNEVDHCEDCEPDYEQMKQAVEEQDRQAKAAERFRQAQQAMASTSQQPSVAAKAVVDQTQNPNQTSNVQPEPVDHNSDGTVIVPGLLGPALLRDPNPQEKMRLKNFLDEPNRDDELSDIIASAMKDHCACDDWYMSIATLPGNQFALYAEDASEIYICADTHARLGNGIYFCPACWNPDSNEYTQDSPGACPNCGGDLKETAYVQKKAGGSKVLARFGRDEIIHGNGDPWLPKLYGNSKVPSVLTELRTAYAMSQFNFRLYSKGRLGKIIGIKGETQDVAEKIAQSVKKQKDKIIYDNYTGQVTREPLLDLFLGLKDGMDVVDVMPDAEKMKSLELLEWMLVKIVGAVYGVQPIMINQQTAPTGYHERMSVSVDQDRTRERQRMIEDVLNEQLIVNAMGIRDWLFKFNDIEGRNLLEEAQIWQAKVKAGTDAVNAGLDAELTEEGELKIGGKFQKQEFGASAQGFMFNNPRGQAKDGGNQPNQSNQPEKPQAFNPTKSRIAKSWKVSEIHEAESNAESD